MSATYDAGLVRAPAGTDAFAMLPAAPLERAACLSLFGFAAALQFSIAAADILLALTTVLWLAMVVRYHERISVPPMFWPLAAYGAATLVASVFSVDPHVSLVDSKQLVLLIIVPLVYRLLRGDGACRDRRDHHGRRDQRHVGHHPVPSSSTTTISDAGRRARSGCT